MDRLRLLITDLDGTLLGDDQALADFKAWYADVKSEWRLVYSSGRFLESIRHSIVTCKLPEPDGVIGGVGTEIHDLTCGARIDDWPPGIDAWSSRRVRAACARYSELHEQPTHLLSPFKVSYYAHELNESYLDRLTLALNRVGLRVTLVYSSNRDLDVLPADTNKGTAASRLAEHWGIRPENIVVAGDSGNDLEMFRSGFRGVVVANAQPELKALRRANVYHARGEYAAGVLEGLRFWLANDTSESITAGRSMPNPSGDRGRRE